jgi:hypothetical protein
LGGVVRVLTYKNREMVCVWREEEERGFTETIEDKLFLRGSIT